MKKLEVLILSLIGIFLTISTVLSSDLVVDLPYYPFKGRMYSGYLSVENPKKKLHYLFIESANDPKNDPLILWLNGGPGCSSLLGWAQEHGPCSFGDESDEFSLNPYSWHKLANIIYLESPAGVGFSYINSEKNEDLVINDAISGAENLEALLDFFKKYPTLKNNPFYIAGESYAGIYVPTLASNIVDYNKNQVSTHKINLKGFAIGNGVTDWKIDTEAAMYDFAWDHALYSPELRAKYISTCSNKDDWDFCDSAKLKIELNFSQVNIYDVYRKCYGMGSSKSGLNIGYKYTPWLLEESRKRREKHSANKSNNFLAYLEEKKEEMIFTLTPPCVDSFGPDEFFNKKEVKAALNVRTDLEWGMCSDDISRMYERDPKGSYYLYPKLIDAGLKILIFSGDSDGAVPINGTQKWISNLNLPVEAPWRSWKVDKSSPVAGYRTIYEGLTFVSVMGTGHMVPQWKPKEAFYMMSKFLKGQDL